MFSIRVLKQEVVILNDRIKTLNKLNYTTDPYAYQEIKDIKMLIGDLEDSISILKAAM